LANSIIGIGSGTDWNTRPIYRFEDMAAIGDYGLAEDTIEPANVTDLDTLAALARAEVNSRRYPRKMLKLEVVNTRGIFNQFDTGDIVAALIPGYSYGGLVVPVRVLGREIDEQSGKLTLVTQVVEGEQASLLTMYTKAKYGDTGGPNGVQYDTLRLG